MRKCYSTNEEDFSHDHIDEASMSAWENAEEPYEIGDEIIVYEGDAREYRASQLLPHIAEYMREMAYDEVGEYSDYWVLTAEDEKELQDLVEEAVDAWATKNHKHPSFYGVRNVKKVRVRFVNTYGECEIVEEAVKQNDVKP